jgi:hypothetical protein
VCRGSGTTLLEHEGGGLSEKTCPYCKGRKTSTWVAEREKSRTGVEGWIKGGITFYLCMLIYSNGWNWWSVSGTGPPAAFVLHCLCWLVAISGLIWWYLHPHPKTARRRARKQQEKLARAHAPGFTSDQEKVMGAALIAGAAYMAHRRSHHPRPPSGPNPGTKYMTGM